MLDLMKFTDSERTELLKSMVILYDTREHNGKNQHILDFFAKKEIKCKQKKLDYGDYSFMIPANPEMGLPRDLYFDREIVIERKASLEELSGNLTNDRDRIKKELTLAPHTKVLLIEGGSYADMCNGNYQTNYNSKSYWASYHSFWHEFTCPIIFMPDKNYTGQFMLGYFAYYLKKQYIG